MSKPNKSIKHWLPRPSIPRIRRTSKEDSAGGIIFRRTDHGVEILLVEDVKNRWSIPKGKIPAGEKSSTAALRESREETGLHNLRLLSWLGKINFKFRHGDALVMKTMEVYLIESFDKDNVVRPPKKPAPGGHEVLKAAKWFSINEALDLIEYEDISKLMLLGLKKIRNGG